MKEQYYILQYNPTGDPTEYFLVNKKGARFGDNFLSTEETILRAVSLGIDKVVTEIPEKLMKRIRKKYSAGELISKVESERL